MGNFQGKFQGIFFVYLGKLEIFLGKFFKIFGGLPIPQQPHIDPSLAGRNSPSSTTKEAQSSQILAVSAERPSRILSKARLGVIAVELRNPDNNRKTKVYALQDTGANATILQKSVAARLGLSGDRTQTTF